MEYEKYVLDSNDVDIKALLESSIDKVSDMVVKRITTQEEIVNIYVIEQYFLRINSMMTLTIITEELPNKIKVLFIITGGDGPLSFSLGASSSFIHKLVKSLEDNGFKRVVKREGQKE